MLLVLRSSATPAIGSGHVMRGAALAEAWLSEGLGTACVWGEVTIPFARRRIESIGLPVTTQPPESGSIILCDDYDAAVRADAARRDAALRVMVDDLGDPVPAGFDAVWNPNACGSPELYPGFGGAVITGHAAVPVRHDLPAWQPRRREHIALMLGGSALESHVAAGARLFAEYLGARRLIAPAALVPGAVPLPEEDPWSSIREAYALITTSGTTIWESAACGIPVVAVRIATNQDLIYRWALASGVPGVDALTLRTAEEVGEALVAAVPKARPLPRLSNGAPAVAHELAALARQAATRP